MKILQSRLFNVKNLPFLIYLSSDSIVSAQLYYQGEKFRAEVDFPQDEYLFPDQVIYSTHYTEFVRTILLNIEFLGQILHAFLVKYPPNKSNIHYQYL